MPTWTKCAYIVIQTSKQIAGKRLHSLQVEGSLNPDLLLLLFTCVSATEPWPEDVLLYQQYAGKD